MPLSSAKVKKETNVYVVGMGKANLHSRINKYMVTSLFLQQSTCRNKNNFGIEKVRRIRI